MSSICFKPAVIFCTGLVLFQCNAAENEPPEPTVVPVEHFVAAEGLEATLWARTPLLRNPTNIDIDAAGRIWAAEGVNYRSQRRRQAGGDRIVVLEDTNGDGKADSSEVFVQEPGLISPLGVAVIDNQVIVSQPPDMIVYTDVNRNRKFEPDIDRREVLLTGFNGQNHDHSLHSVTVGPNGLWYWNQGNTGALFTDRSGKTFRVGSPYNAAGSQPVADPTKIAGQRSDDGHVWIGGFTARMNPDGTNVEIIGHNYRNSYEQVVTSLGDVFQSDNDDPPACRVSFVMEYGNAGFASLDGQRSWRADQRPGQSVQVAEWRQEDPGSMPSGDVYGGGSPTGVAFYENGALGERFQGMLLTCEAGRNVIFGYFPKIEGAGFRLERFDFLTSNKEKKFGGSDFLGGGRSVRREIKTYFRPSDVTVGPDGAIYVADWYDPRVGGHSTLDRTLSGAIYRVAPKGFKSTVPQLDLSTTAGQIAALKSPAQNVRSLGFYRLRSQGEKAVPAVAALLREDNPFIAARAIWLLAQLGQEGIAKVTALLSAGDERTRIAAFRALRHVNHDLPGMAKRLAKDPSPAVRREAAIASRNLPLVERRPVLVEIAKRYDGKDRSYLEALGTGCTGYEEELYDAIADGMNASSPARWSSAFARIAWRLSAPQAVSGLKARSAASSLSPEERKLALNGLAFVKSRTASDAMLSLVESAGFSLKKDAMWWLFNRSNNLWKEYGVLDAMRKRGLYNPDAEDFVSATLPERSRESSPPPVEEILKLDGNPKRGQQIATACAVCHQIGLEAGTDYGPDLTSFGATQTREVIVRSIVDPSAEISHGYQGSEVITKNGVRIQGLILAMGDPLIIQSQGGLIQTIPASKLARRSRRFNRSLMLSAEEQGLSAQDVADVTAYLKSNLLRTSR